MSPSRTWPKPWPPSSGGRCAAHSPRSLTCSCSGRSARSSRSASRSSVSSGQISSRTNAAIQSSSAWNAGSVQKSHAMAREGTCATVSLSAPMPDPPPRPADRDRRVVPAPGGPGVAHAHRRARDRRGPGAGVRRLPRLDPPPPALRAALPPAARVPAGELGPPAVDRRHGLQPRVPRAPHRAARARQPRAAHEPRRARVLPAARPLQAAVGDVAHRGPRRRQLRRCSRRPTTR